MTVLRNYSNLTDAVAFVAFAGFPLLVPTLATAAPVVPDAFTELLSVTSENRRFSLQKVSGPQSGEVSGFVDFTTAIASGSALAAASGFSQAITAPNNFPAVGAVTAVAHTTHQVNNPGFSRGTGHASALLDFYFFVGLSGSAAGVTQVPVDITAVGRHNVSVAGGSGGGTGQARIVVSTMVPGGGLPEFSLSTSDPAFGDNHSGSFRETRRVLMAPDETLRILLRVITDATAGGGETQADAFVDPSFVIPLDFAQRDSFSFEVSPNLTQVPEPSCLVPWLMGVLAFAYRSRRRRNST